MVGVSERHAHRRRRRDSGWPVLLCADAWLQRAWGASPEDIAHLNEKVGLVVSLFMLPLPVALHRLTCARGWRLSWLAMAFGVLGWLTITVTQALLIITRISFEVTQPFAMVGLTLIGVWMIVANYCVRAGAALSRWLTWLGEIIGASFLLAVAAIMLSLMSDMLAAMVVVLAIPGALAFVFGFPFWLIWLGRGLLSAQITPQVSSQHPRHLAPHSGTSPLGGDTIR